MKCIVFTVTILVSSLCQEKIQGSDITLRHVEKRGRPPRSCSYLPAPGCTCRSRYGRISFSCVGLGLTEFPTMDVIPPGELINLDISGNRFTEIPYNAFNGVTLGRLVIRNNDSPDDVGMTWQVLDGQQSLSYIDMSNTRVGVHYHWVLNSLDNLRTLKLVNCRIMVLPDVHIGFKSLERLELDNNPILSARPDAFKAMPGSLKHLSLSMSALGGTVAERLEAFIPCKYLKNLETLELYNVNVKDRLKTLTRTRCLPKLKSLTCSRCWLTDKRLRFINNDNGDQFEKISLPHNKLGNKSLKRLLNDGLGRPRLPNLRVLELPFCEISEVRGVTVDMLPSLVSLDLSYNRLASFPPELFLSPDLAYVDLSYNSLSGPDTPYMMDWESRHLTVRLQGNPLMCTCDLDLLIMMQRQLAGESGPLIPYEIETLTCSGPDNLKGIKVATVASDIHCSYPIYPTSN